MTSVAVVAAETQIINLVHDVLKISYLEEAFNCVIVHHTDVEETNVRRFHQEFVTAFGLLTADQKESVFRQYLLLAATRSSVHHLKFLLSTVQQLINANAITARVVCEQILLCEKLTYANQAFWIGCFQLIRRIISGVDYKGVREIMKGCRDKMQSFPVNLSTGILPQIQCVEKLLEHIFDRNACLLPAYFIANEIQKAAPFHWKIARLTSSFVEDFRNIAQMVSIIGHAQMRPIVEHFGYTDTCILPWRLDCATLKLAVKGILPYDAELIQPQTGLLRFVLEQPYSKDMVCSMLNLQKQCKVRCVAIEEQLVWLIMSAMERSELDPVADGEQDDAQNPTHWLWVHISSQLIYFVMFQIASFPSIVQSLHSKFLQRPDLRRGRDYLMWTLLQFVSGSIHRNPLSSFLSVLSLYDTLYPEKEPLPVPDCTKPYCTRQMSPTCIWFHLQKKAQSDNMHIQRPMPITLKKHHEFLQHLMLSNGNKSLTMSSDFTIVLMCNAYSTHPDYFSRPMAAIGEAINKYAPAHSNSGNQQPVTYPLPMVTLDCLTVHAKMSLIHSIVAHMIKQAQAQAKATMSNSVTNIDPALVETYSRLLVYTEIESLGIKMFLSQLLPAVFKSQAWGILHTLLEMVSYRMHHIQPFYRVQLLSHLHSLASVPHTNMMQLHLCVESTALRLITGLGSAEVQPQLSRYYAEPKLAGSAVSLENEELNRALILSIARSMHITGAGNDDSAPLWCKDLLTSIMQNTPHTWAPHTLQCFPPVLNNFFALTSIPKENRALIKKAVEEEFRNWNSMSNENDIIAHFGVAGKPPLFLCLLFKMILETNAISAVAYKILERIGARALSTHLRKLCDYLVYEVTHSCHNMHINKCVDTINDMIWKFNVFSIDRLVLTLSLGTHEGKEAHVCFYIIQLLLLKTHEFRSRVGEFVKDNEPDHWKQSNWHEKHVAFHHTYREKFFPDESVSHPPVLPVYFGNVCLRFLPVLDLVIHRFLEVPITTVNKTLEIILEHLGCMYKFHERPITYVYHTLHYYETKLRERPVLKKRLVAAITDSFAGLRPDNWALTIDYQLKYVKQPDKEAIAWKPDIKYYMSLFRRFVGTMTGKNIFYLTDWRFNEFPNAVAHAMYVTCVELLSLPVNPSVVANSVIDVIVLGFPVIPQDQLHHYINAVGILMTALPETFWSCIYDRLHDALVSHKMVNWSYRQTPFEMFNFRTVNEAMLEKQFVSLLAVAHSILHHSSTGQISTLANYIKEKLKPAIQTEHQLIYLCHLFAPFMARLDQERARVGYELTTLLYELLEQVDKKHGMSPLIYMDPICDLLYHIKYMFVGDILKNESEAIIRRLRPALQMRLRFITHLSVDEIALESAPIAPVDMDISAAPTATTQQTVRTVVAPPVQRSVTPSTSEQQHLQQPIASPQQLNQQQTQQSSPMQQQQQQQQTMLQQQQQPQPQQPQQMQQMLQQQMLQPNNNNSNNPVNMPQQMLPQQSPQHQMMQQQQQPSPQQQQQQQQLLQQQQQQMLQQQQQQQMMQQQQQQQQPQQQQQQQMMQQLQHQSQFQHMQQMQGMNPNNRQH